MKKKILAPVVAAVMLLSNGMTAFAGEGAYLDTYDNTRLEEKDYSFEKPGVNRPTPFEDAMLEMWRFTVDLTIFQKSQNFYSKIPNPNRKNPVRATVFSNWSDSYQLSEEWGDGWSIFYEYDAQGNLVSVYDPPVDGSSGNTKQYTYDAQGRLLSETDVHYPSDPSISPYTITLQYAYDPQGRIISAVNDVDGSKESYKYTYDAAGNVLTFTDKKDFVDHYNIVTKHSYTRDTHGNVLTYTIDSGGYVTKESHALTYDAQGGLLQDDISYTGPNEEGSTQVKYAYDEAGNLLSREYIVYYPCEPRVFQFTYDAMGNVLAFTGRDASASGPNTYITNGNITYMAAEDYRYYRNDRLAYDAAGNVLTHVTEGAVSNIYRQYTYDAMGNLLTYTKDYVDPASGRTAESHLIQYTYDALGNLSTYTEATYSPSGVDGYRVQYFYE